MTGTPRPLSSRNYAALITVLGHLTLSPFCYPLARVPATMCFLTRFFLLFV